MAQAAVTLPPAATAEDWDYPVQMDAGHGGLVHITFRRQKARQAKRTHWFWLATRALQKNFCCEVRISNWDLVGAGGYVGEA